MFNHSDPVNTGLLNAHGALSAYRSIVESFYDFAAGIEETRFVGLDRMPVTAPRQSIVWPAFPITAPVADAQIDSERWNWQDEYVEWRIVRSLGAIESIVFTTEFPEYYEALAEISANALIAGIQDAIPGADPTNAELFGAGFDPNAATPAQRAQRFRDHAVVPFRSQQNTVPPNPWNNGGKGILCLMQQFNTMGALFNLAAQCAVPNPAIPPGSQCGAVGGACGPNRNSDPRICSRAQEVSRIPRALALADPVGVRIVTLNGTWRSNGNIFDINDPDANKGVWVLDRGGRRGTLRPTPGMTLNNAAISGGTQVSRFLDVGADVVSATPDELLPLAAAEALAGRRIHGLPGRNL